ncbi:MAG: hypothetical protein HY040_10665 [Planctomycetes bacterium]|nr:hypothetical protein [Planctomycetota bacterium]
MSNEFGATFLALSFFVLTGGLQAQELKAGAAKIAITPPTGFPLWGYSARRDSPSTGVHDPLFARSVVLAVGKEKLALVSLDLGRPPTRERTASIRKRLKEAGVDHVFLAASHTHHGPVLELDNWPDPKKPYVRTLEDRIIQATLEALKELRPVRLGIAREEGDWNRNRHAKRNDRPLDKELLVVRIEDSQKQALAHLVNLAAHATMRDSKLRDFSADFPGALARKVEKEAGGVCLFLQGAAGDLSPNPKPGDGADEFGEALADRVLNWTKDMRCELMEPKSLKVREHDFTFGKRFDIGQPLVRAAFSMVFFKDLIDFYEREYRDGIRPHLTTALLDERIGIVGVSGEFFCGHALNLKKRARLEHLLFVGYCNDYQQYFPTIEAVAEGGYGAEATVSPVEIGAGERIMDQALIDLLEMRGKIRKEELPKR